MFQHSSRPPAVKSDGTKVQYVPGKGYTLTAGTWSIDVSQPDPINVAVHVTWDSALTGTVNYQDSNLPAFASLSAPYTDSSASTDVALNDATAGNWVPNNSPTITSTTGGTAAGGTLTIAGGTAGGARFDITGAARRGRMQLVLSVGGAFRCHDHGKQA